MGLCNYAEEDIKRHLKITQEQIIARGNLIGAIEHLDALLVDLERNKCEMQFAKYYNSIKNYISQFYKFDNTKRKTIIKFEEKSKKKLLEEVSIFISNLF